ncbi:MAG: hypothetical protein AB7K68_00830 [Bacteriovoracia bacterium]
MKTLFLLAALVSTPAFAVGNFSGHWLTTTGKINSTVGIKGDCSKIEIVIEQKEGLLLTKQYRANCGTYDSNWGPVAQTIRDGKVFEGEGEDEEQVGTITDTTLITVSRSGGVSYAYNLKLHPQPDGSVLLQSYYGVKNAVGAIAIEGLMLQASP